ncbi:MAG: FMN-binding negative transcriptional regulator [Pseudomonadota bacterium]
MHPSTAFHADREDALSFIEAHPFATLAVNGPNGPLSALAPLVLGEKASELIGHVSRHNPFWQIAGVVPVKAIAIFHGGDAYVSASAYASKKDHGRVVPTWNYLAVEVRGTLSIEADPEKVRPYIDALTDRMETVREQPWSVSDAPADYIDRLSGGIVGLRLSLDEITYVRKLSQNKSDADKSGVERDLRRSSDTCAHFIANEMLNEGNRV